MRLGDFGISHEVENRNSRACNERSRSRASPLVCSYKEVKGGIRGRGFYNFRNLMNNKTEV